MVTIYEINLVLQCRFERIAKAHIIMRMSARLSAVRAGVIKSDCLLLSSIDNLLEK